ncbi:cell division ATP-binding protein FtsE [Latilactobacillus curvatus]|uniref:Cell division ATP-binding protein FtsE n=2 Tax=Latilactobacillus curvatus TaxID=28038 RepID=A0A385AFF2_LATCU|nr:cell division ATP-binding protein FtsE [Latilactobacillus curvatus]AXN36351.1 cell division ATP-binding protein FtsE [Latilactobacillus curvatus]AZP95947.1 cell division ATP-binding protein FtsE [Latilactobacillus curvatus]MCT1216309.1 cell division ATP-binding protein FtsE [Latilactobacillus curvatus]MCT3359532.1 cell division ATP-binding protein FtsE [Latilactobacillus curvatus]MCT3525738.1 cell division ATP-binding protein FtsE [Latilactobacillus curvatus]
MIRMTNVSKKYPNGVTAIKDLSLTIEPGEFAYIVGPSGAGKSTFIKMLYHQLKATSGEIEVAGFDLIGMKDHDVPYLRRKMGVVFQDFKLLPRLTVFENVAYAMEVIEAEPEAIKDRVLEVLELVGLKGEIRRFPNELSGGEQQRVAVARAIVNRPDVLIADEPTGNLDPETSDGIMDILEAINERGTIVLMATHNKQMVNERTHRVLAIEDGRLVRDEKEGDYGYED